MGFDYDKVLEQLQIVVQKWWLWWQDDSYKSDDIESDSDSTENDKIIEEIMMAFLFNN